MKIQERFKEMLLPVSRKIKKECNYNSKSCTDEFSFIRLGFKSIKKELMETLEITALLNPTARDWEKIRETGKDFLKLQIETLKNGYSRLWEDTSNHQGDIISLEKEVF